METDDDRHWPVLLKCLILSRWAIFSTAMGRRGREAREIADAVGGSTMVTEDANDDWYT